MIRNDHRAFIHPTIVYGFAIVFVVVGLIIFGVI